WGNVSNYSSRQGWEGGERCPVRGGPTGLYSFQRPTSVVPSRPARGQMGLYALRFLRTKGGRKNERKDHHPRSSNVVCIRRSVGSTAESPHWQLEGQPRQVDVQSRPSPEGYNDQAGAVGR